MSYHDLYDAHYRAAYAQGLDFWSDGPDGCQVAIQRISGMVREALGRAGGTRLIEFGCGEGIQAPSLVALGAQYMGVDCSPAAIARGMDRVKALGLAADFRVMNVLDAAKEFDAGSFHVALDVAFLHMLVIDRDMWAYLDIVRRLLKPTGTFVLANLSRHDKAYLGAIESIEQYEKLFGVDLSSRRQWEGWSRKEGKWVPVECPAFAGRPRNLAAYSDILEAAGFEIVVANERERAIDFIVVPGTSSG